MNIFISLTRTGEWMVTIPGSDDADGDQSRVHKWCKDKKELIQHLVQVIPENK